MIAIRPLEVRRDTHHASGINEVGILRIKRIREGRHAARQKAVGVGERRHVVELLADREGLLVRTRIPLVAGHTAPEKPGAGANRRLAIPKRIPRDANAGSEVPLLHRHDAARDAGVAREQHARRNTWINVRNPALDESGLTVMLVYRRRLQVVTEAQVQGEARLDAIVVLQEKPGIPEIVLRGNR